MDEQIIDEALSDYQQRLILITMVVLILALIASGLIAGWVARPIEVMGGGGYAVLEKGALDTRIEPAGSREFQRLAGRFNAMAAKLQDMVRGSDSVTGNSFGGT